MDTNQFDFKNEKWEISFENLSTREKEACKDFLEKIYGQSSTPIMGWGFSNTTSDGVLNPGRFYWVSDKRDTEALGCATITPRFKTTVDDFIVIRNKSKAQLDIEKLEKIIQDAQNQIQKLKENI